MAINDPASKLAKKINNLVDLKIRKKAKKSPVIKSGKVVKIDPDGTPWVSVSGSNEATPVNGEVLANIKLGDQVSINIENGKCNILGNPGDPSIGSNEAKNVSNQEIKIAVEQGGTIGRAIDVESNKTIDKLDGMISDQFVPIEEAIEDLSLKNKEEVRTLRNQTSSAINISNEVKEMAEATNQHFWYDDGGAHVTEVTQEEWNTSPSGFNSLFNSLGLLLRKALNNIAAFTHSAVTFFDGDGNDSENITASFGSDGAQIGKKDSYHTKITGNSLSIKLAEDRLIETSHDGTTATIHVGASTLARPELYAGVFIDFNNSRQADLNLYMEDITLDSEVFVYKATSVFPFGTFLYEEFEDDSSSEFGTQIYTLRDSDGDFMYKVYQHIFYNNIENPLSIWPFNDTRYSYVLDVYPSIHASYQYVWLNEDDSFNSEAAHYKWEMNVSGLYVPMSEIPASGFELTANADETVFEVGADTLKIKNADLIVEDGCIKNTDIKNANRIEASWIETQNLSVDNQIIIYNEDSNGNVTAADTFSMATDGSLYITIQDSSGYKYRFYMSSYGNLARQEHISSGWGSADYFITRSLLEARFSCYSIDATIGSVSANSTKWLSVSSTRSGYTAIAMVGYYIDGAAQLGVYCARMNGTNGQFAFRNGTSSATSASATLHVQFLYVANS